MKDDGFPPSRKIDLKQYEKMSSGEKWAYLNEKIREIDARVKKIIYK